MQITILEYFKDARNNKIASFDIRIDYENQKFEIFRNIALFMKDNKKWISFPSMKRDEKWIPLYERSGSMKEVINQTLKAIDDYMLANP